jgi:hypothetical protein
MGVNLQQEWQAVSGAPFLTLGAVLAIGAIIWAILHFLYRHRIEGLKEALERERAMSHVTADKGAPSNEKALPTTGTSPASRDLFVLIHRTMLDAAQARADSRNVRTAEKQLPSIGAVLITLNKEKGLRIPVATGRPNTDLEMYCRFLEKVAPLLRLGHDEEARQVAEDYSARMDVIS